MPSFSARAVATILRTTKVYKKQFSGGPDFPKYQAKALAASQGPAAKWHKKLAVKDHEFQGRPVWTIAPRDKEPAITVLYWHGGGYVYPPSPGHWDFMGYMAETYGWRIIAPLYPLAPENKAETITQFALDFYRETVKWQDPATLVMAGDSAGGGLTASTAMLARDAGLPLPAKLILICPWLNAMPDHPDQAVIERRDCILGIGGIRDAGQMYAGAAGVADPRVSPIFGNWDGLPPIFAFGGGDDILVTDARALKQKCPEISYAEKEGMMHVWPLFFFPESRQAQKAMALFAQGDVK